MDDGDAMNPIDLSIEAALELEEFKQGVRRDTPALTSLFDFIRTPGPAFDGQSISMLADVRAYALFRDSLGERTKTRPANLHEFRRWVAKYLEDLEVGVAKRVHKDVDEAKRFCLALNAHMLARQMNELNNRRDRSEPRHVNQ